jgi:hypothetical protein
MVFAKSFVVLIWWNTTIFCSSDFSFDWVDATLSHELEDVCFLLRPNIRQKPPFFSPLLSFSFFSLLEILPLMGLANGSSYGLKGMVIEFPLFN